MKKLCFLLHLFLLTNTNIHFIFSQASFEPHYHEQEYDATLDLELEQEYENLQALREEPLRMSEWLNTEREHSIVFAKDKICISLGKNCGPGRHFERHKLTEAFFPFDWCISDASSVIKAFSLDFKDFLKRENIIIGTKKNAHHRWITDKEYNITFVHDFSRDRQPLHDYEEIKKKYYRRIDRLYKVLSLGKEVYFFRTMITKKEAIELNNLIKQKFPTLKYTLVVVSSYKSHKKQWGIKNIKNFYFKLAKNAWVYPVYQKRWDDIFKELQLI